MRASRESQQEGGNPRFGELLRRQRLAASLTQEELAERAGVSARGMRALEQGERRRPQSHTVRQLAEALKLEGEERAAFEQAARRREEPAPGRSGRSDTRLAASMPLTDLRNAQDREASWQSPSRLSVPGRRLTTPQPYFWKGLLRLATDRRNAALYLVAGLVAATSLVPLTLAVIMIAATGSRVIFLLLACLTLNLVVTVVGVTGSLALLIAAWRDRTLVPVAEGDNAGAKTLPRSHSLLSGEMGRLFQICAQNPTSAGARDGALFAVLYGGCLSIAQAAALDMSDYDRESGTLAVRWGKKDGRASHLRNGARHAMEDWLAIRGDEAGPLFLPTDPNGEIESRPAIGAPRRITRRATRETLRKRAEEAHAAPFTRPRAARAFLPLSDSVIAVFFAGRPPEFDV